MGEIPDGEEAKTYRKHQRRNNHIDPHRDRQPRRNCQSNGNQPFGVNNQDWVRGDSYRPRNPTTGGMLSQLIAEEDDQLADYEFEIQRLQQKIEKSKARRNRYSEMLSELEERVKDNP